jgi:hypothetical protein
VTHCSEFSRRHFKNNDGFSSWHGLLRQNKYEDVVLKSSAVWTYISYFLTVTALSRHFSGPEAERSEGETGAAAGTPDEARDLRILGRFHMVQGVD